MLRPDGGLIGFHFFAGRHGDIGTAGDHPRADADTLREYDGAFGGALPQGAAEVAVGQRQDVGQRNDVGGVAVVDDAVGAVGGGFAHAVVHKVAGKFRGGLGAVGKTPDDAPAVARSVDFHDADAVDGVRLNVAEELARPGGEEIFPGEVVGLHAHIDPGAGRSVKEGAAGGDVGVGHTVGQVAAVAFVPALQPAVVAHTDKALYAGNGKDSRHKFAPFLLKLRVGS